MHITEFEALDKEHQFDSMLDIIELDPGFLLWIKLSRLTFGAWQIEAYTPFEKHRAFVTNYDDPRSFMANWNLWLSKARGATLGQSI